MGQLLGQLNKNLLLLTPMVLVLLFYVSATYVISGSTQTRDRVCMVSLYCCIVACTHLGNSTGHKTVALAAPLLLLACGPVRYEAELDRCETSSVGEREGTNL